MQSLRVNISNANILFLQASAMCKGFIALQSVKNAAG
jgi:hypothetical protein